MGTLEKSSGVCYDTITHNHSQAYWPRRKDLQSLQPSQVQISQLSSSLPLHQDRYRLMQLNVCTSLCSKQMTVYQASVFQFNNTVRCLLPFLNNYSPFGTAQTSGKTVGGWILFPTHSWSLQSVSLPLAVLYASDLDQSIPLSLLSTRKSTTWTEHAQFYQKHVSNNWTHPQVLSRQGQFQRACAN